MVKTVKRHRVKTYRTKTKKSLKVIKKERACESIKCPVPEPRLVSIYTKEALMAVDKMPAEFRSSEKYMNYLVKSFKNITKGYLTYETKDLRNNFYNFINNITIIIKCNIRKYSVIISIIYIKNGIMLDISI